jgi:hypothetical protein
MLKIMMGGEIQLQSTSKGMLTGWCVSTCVVTVNLSWAWNPNEQRK